MKPTEPFKFILRNNSLHVMIYALPCSASLFSLQNIFFYIYNLETRFSFINIVSASLPFFQNTLSLLITIKYTKISLKGTRALTVKTQNIHIDTFAVKKCNVLSLCLSFFLLCPCCFHLSLLFSSACPPQKKTHGPAFYLPSLFPLSFFFHKHTDTTTASFFKREE